MSDQTAEGYRHIGTGQAVFESEEPADGTRIRLDVSRGEQGHVYAVDES